MRKYKKFFVIRGECGAFFAGHESGGYIIGKKKDAKRFDTVAQAVRAFPKWGKWEVVEYEKPAIYHTATKDRQP